ncbi:hypothetical protein Q3G72_010823 [Acer saccharum]|nr:hypothetical protein Q3G72_010823 [Acer saccharum]
MSFDLSVTKPVLDTVKSTTTAKPLQEQYVKARNLSKLRSDQYCNSKNCSKHEIMSLNSADVPNNSSSFADVVCHAIYYLLSCYDTSAKYADMAEIVNTKRAQ